MEKSFFTEDGEPSFTNFKESLNELNTDYKSIYDMLSPSNWSKDGLGADTLWECIENNVSLPDDFDPKKFDKKVFLQKLDDHHKKVEHFLNMLDEFGEHIEQVKAEITEALDMKEYYSKKIDEYVKSDLKKRKNINIEFDNYACCLLDMIEMFVDGNKNNEDDNNSEASLN